MNMDSNLPTTAESLQNTLPKTSLAWITQLQAIIITSCASAVIKLPLPDKWQIHCKCRGFLWQHIIYLSEAYNVDIINVSVYG